MWCLQRVVNYIQILYLCILKQLAELFPWLFHGCELHSNLVSLHSETTLGTRCRKAVRLWITFKSCIFAFWNNPFIRSNIVVRVVNYIQILYLCILKQLGCWRVRKRSSCELHSNLVSLHSETTCRIDMFLLLKLWITFKSCIFAFWNNLFLLHSVWKWVVNYIQILYLCILKQQSDLADILACSCELHSNLVSLHSETTVNSGEMILNRCELHSNLVSLHSETTLPN